MPEDLSAETRKRILFITTVLGVMTGVLLYLAFKAVRHENYALLAVVPAVALTAIPMIRSLLRLKSESRSGER